jgi:putative transposase
MKKSRFTETQIVDALKRHENGQSVADLARELGITPATFYAWRKKYAGKLPQKLDKSKLY